LVRRFCRDGQEDTWFETALFLAQRYCRLADRFLGRTGHQKYCEPLAQSTQRLEARERHLQAQEDDRQWRHGRQMAAINQEKRKYEEKNDSLARGEAAVEDSSTYN